MFYKQVQAPVCSILAKRGLEWHCSSESTTDHVSCLAEGALTGERFDPAEFYEPPWEFPYATPPVEMAERIAATVQKVVAVVVAEYPFKRDTREVRRKMLHPFVC